MALNLGVGINQLNHRKPLGLNDEWKHRLSRLHLASAHLIDPLIDSLMSEDKPLTALGVVDPTAWQRKDGKLPRLFKVVSSSFGQFLCAMNSHIILKDICGCIEVCTITPLLL